MPRPKGWVNPKTPRKEAVCDTHGVVLMSGHKKNGNIVWRCPDCHYDYNQAHVTGAIPVQRRPTEECKHEMMVRDPDRDESWCLGYRCPKCGLETIEARTA